MGRTKAAPRTDHDYNNSELKTYTGSNGDIMQELDKFKKQVIEVTGRQEELGSDSHALNSALQAAIDTEEEVQTKMADPVESPERNQKPSTNKGKTQTVLFKSDKLLQIPMENPF